MIKNILSNNNRLVVSIFVFALSVFVALLWRPASYLWVAHYIFGGYGSGAIVNVDMYVYEKVSRNEEFLKTRYFVRRGVELNEAIYFKNYIVSLDTKSLLINTEKVTNLLALSENISDKEMARYYLILASMSLCASNEVKKEKYLNVARQYGATISKVDFIELTINSFKKCKYH